MKTITKFSIFMLTFSWIGFLITTIHFMRLAEVPSSTLWLFIPLVIGLASSCISILWMQKPDIWKSIDELQNVRKVYNRKTYYLEVFRKALKIEMLERSLPFKDVEKRAEDLEKEEYGENGYQDN